MSAPGCSKRVHEGSRSYACSRRGAVERDGKWYCRQHDPDSVQAQRAASDAAYRARCQEQDRIHAEGVALLKRFGKGSVYYESSGPFSRNGYRRAVVVAFDDLDALLREIGR